MNIIKLNATHSTNTYMRELSAIKDLEDFSVVWALDQTNGRGQMGTVWNAQPGKNLTISVYKDVSWLGISNHFFISIVVSLALIHTLNELMIKNLKIKWPNDILSDYKKIGGILIENVIKNNQLQASIIGIGLNVNQTDFDNLPQASSLINITGRIFSLEELLERTLANLKSKFLELKENHAFEELKKSYTNALFRLNKPSTFKDKSNNLFSGYIYGTDQQGNLLVLLENKVIKSFGFKEITLLY
jgi:BirA family biotin operon repressor/biotin-[acetyl-CoA-carboxylase] ligase